MKWAYILEHPGADPLVDRMALETSGQTTVVVAVPDSDSALAVAARLADDGVRLIELCGGFSVEDVARVRSAVPAWVAIGHVTFAVDSLLAAADYSVAFEAQFAQEQQSSPR
jgi:phosphoribosylformylglycinamidine (FGAM) synthase-like amidotransferase family enzyme